MKFSYFSKKDASFLFTNFTLSALFYNFLIDTLPQIGVDIKKVEGYTNFEISKISQDKRVSIIKAYKLWEGIEKVSNRSDIGLIIADYFTLSKAGTIGKLFIHTKNLRESVKIMKRFLSLIINNINTKYVEIDDFVIFYFDIVPRFVIPLSVVECYAKICYNWIKEYTSLKTLPIKEINFYGKKPKHISFYYKTFPNAKIFFNQYTNYAVIDKKIFYIPNFRKIYSPYDFIFQHVQNAKKELFTKSSWTQKIVNEIITNLPEGNSNIKIIASHLNVSVSTLKRNLKKEDVSFKQLTELIRKKLSFYMVKDEKLSYEEISFLLGYSEYSSFFRAFKKWFHLTPSDFRRSK
jgi:AraC-like DNA-binding protein